MEAFFLLKKIENSICKFQKNWDKNILMLTIMGPTSMQKINPKFIVL
jgi:hypothetical protein